MKDRLKFKETLLRGMGEEYEIATLFSINDFLEKYESKVNFVLKRSLSTLGHIHLKINDSLYHFLKKNHKRITDAEITWDEKNPSKAIEIRYLKTLFYAYPNQMVRIGKIKDDK